MKKFKISIIIPVTYLPIIDYSTFLFNQLKYFEDKDIEIILVDNSDVYGFIEKVLKKLNKLKNVKVVKYPFKFSLPKMFNYAFKFASGDYILFIKNFCFLYEDILIKLAKYLKEENKEKTYVVSAVEKRSIHQHLKFGEKAINFINALYFLLRKFSKVYFFVKSKRKQESVRFILKLVSYMYFLIEFIYYLLRKNKKVEVKQTVLFFGILFIKKEDFEKVGRFDENYYNFFYDTDFYLKAKDNGYKMIVDQNLKIKYYPFLEISVFKYNDFPYNFDKIRFMKKWIVKTSNSSKNILVVKLMTLGDAILVTPTIKALKEKYIDYKITLLSMKPWSEVFEGNPYVDELIVLPNCSKYKIMNHRIYDIITSKFLNFRDWEFVFQLNCLDHYPEYRRTSLHLRDFYASMAGVYPLKDKKYYIFISDVEKESVKRLLKELKLDEKRYVVIHTNAGWQLKNWDAEKWIQLIELLYKKFGYKTILIGGKDEGKDIYSEHLYNLAGKLKLKEVATLIEFSKLFIGLDSGISHLASCMDVPVVMLFGNTHPKVAEPNCSKYICIHSSASCEIPCGLKFCIKKINCTSMISVKSVFKAVNMLLEEKNLLQEIWVEDSPADVFFKDWEWHIRPK